MVDAGFTTCLWFDGQAEEAANHYVSIFRNSRIGTITRTGKSGPGPEGSVVTVDFEANGHRFVALNGGPQFTFNEAISFMVLCDDQDEVDYYWSRLGEGGEERPCGWVQDRFGVSWQVVPKVLLTMTNDPDPEKADRVTAQMLTMGKLDIEPLERAYAGE